MIFCLLCAISSNLDTLSVCTSYSMKKIKLPISSMAVISFISSLGTYLSMKFGTLIIEYANVNFINVVGSVSLILIGLYFIYSCLIKKDYAKTVLFEDPTIADADNSGIIDFKEAMILATILTINNVGVGIAMAIVGVNAMITTIFTFIITFISIFLGFYIGKKVTSKKFGKLAEVCSGLLILLIGVVKLIS